MNSIIEKYNRQQTSELNKKANRNIVTYQSMQVNKTNSFQPMQKKARVNYANYDTVSSNSNKESLVIKPIIIVQVNITNALKAQLPIYSQQPEQINRDIFQFLKSHRIKEVALPIIREMVIAQLRKLKTSKLPTPTQSNQFSVQTFSSQTSSLNQTGEKNKALNLLFNLKNGSSGTKKKIQNIDIAPLFPDSSQKSRSPKGISNSKSNKKNILCQQANKISKDKFSLQKLLNEEVKSSNKSNVDNLQVSNDYNKENQSFQKKNVNNLRICLKRAKQLRIDIVQPQSIIEPYKSSSPTRLDNNKKSNQIALKVSTKLNISKDSKQKKLNYRIEIPNKYDQNYEECFKDQQKQQNENFEYIKNQQKSKHRRVPSKDPRQKLSVNRYNTQFSQQQQQKGVERYSQNLINDRKLKKKRPEPLKFDQELYSSQLSINQHGSNYSFSQKVQNQGVNQNYCHEGQKILNQSNALRQSDPSDSDDIKQYSMKDLQADMHSQMSQILIQKAVKKLKPRINELYKSLTKDNPPNLNRIHIEYINFSDLSQRQLCSLQQLFEKMSEFELNNLTLKGLQSVIVKYNAQSLVASLK